MAAFDIQSGIIDGNAGDVVVQGALWDLQSAIALDGQHGYSIFFRPIQHNTLISPEGSRVEFQSYMALHMNATIHVHAVRYVSVSVRPCRWRIIS